jgi:co-chaperonin GroES (HSP10)
MNILPCNRYLLVSPNEEEAETENTILLPTDFRTRASHGMAKVLAIAEDSKFKGYEGKNVIVNNNLVEELDICGSTYHFILENHIIGLVEEN